MTSAPEWESLGEGLWVHTKTDRNGWSLRTHALRLRDGSLLVHSPTKNLADTVHASLASMGPVRWLLAPNYFHHLGLPQWKERYSSARIVCTDAAMTRLQDQHKALRFESCGLLREFLPEDASLLEPVGLKNGELFLSVRAHDGPAWLVCDAFFHEVNPPTGLVGLFLRLTKTAPGLCLGRTFTALAVKDTEAYRGWLRAKLTEHRPQVLLPSHGTPVTPNAWEKLQAVVTERLG